jgi:hypothetical protein
MLRSEPPNYCLDLTRPAAIVLLHASASATIGAGRPRSKGAQACVIEAVLAAQAGGRYASSQEND